MLNLTKMWMRRKRQNLYCIWRWATTSKLSLFSSVEKTSVRFCLIRDWSTTGNKLRINRN